MQLIDTTKQQPTIKTINELPTRLLNGPIVPTRDEITWHIPSQRTSHLQGVDPLKRRSEGKKRNERSNKHPNFLDVTAPLLSAKSNVVTAATAARSPPEQTGFWNSKCAAFTSLLSSTLQLFLPLESVTFFDWYQWISKSTTKSRRVRPGDGLYKL